MILAAYSHRKFYLRVATELNFVLELHRDINDVSGITSQKKFLTAVKAGAQPVLD